MKTWLICGAAVLAGFGVGICVAPAPSSAKARSAAVTSGASRSHSSSATLGLPAIDVPPPSSPDFAAGVARFLDGAKTGGRDALLAKLAAVMNDRTLPPTLADYFEKVLLVRLVELGAARDALSLGDPRQREAATRIVIEALAKRDPAAAEALLGELVSPQQKSLAIRALFKVLGGTRPERGLELLREHPEWKDDGYYFFEVWAEKEPRNALEVVLKLPKDTGGSYLQGVFYQWAADDPEKALAAIKELPADQQFLARMGSVNAMVNEDPDRALDMLLANPELESGMFGQWIGRGLADDRKSADALLERVPPGDFRSRIIQGVAENLYDSDPAEMIAWAQTLLPGERESAIDVVIGSIASDDPVAAMKLAAEQLKGSSAEQQIAMVASEWLDDDFEAAFAGITSQFHGDSLERLLGSEYLWSTYYQTVGKDPGIQLEAVSRLEPKLRKAALEAIGSQWGDVDPEALRGHLDELAPADRAALVSGALEGMSRGGQPQLVAEFARQLPPKSQLESARRIADAMSYDDPVGAAKFILAMPGDLNSRISAMDSVISSWASDDPSAATSFVAALPAGEARDDAALKLSVQLLEFDPAAATNQLAGMSDSGSRGMLIKELAKTWKHLDPERGRALLLAAAKSDEERKAIAEGMETR